MIIWMVSLSKFLKQILLRNFAKFKIEMLNEELAKSPLEAKYAKLTIEMS